MQCTFWNLVTHCYVQRKCIYSRYRNRINKTFTLSFSVIKLLKSVADLHSKIFERPPVKISLYFHAVFGKIWGLTPLFQKSWIRPENGLKGLNRGGGLGLGFGGVFPEQ